MPPPELADFMAQTCDSSFTKHCQAIIDNAVGGGIVCALGEQSLRTFLTDISITLKPQQDFIIEGLDNLKKTTEVAVAALEESGSPYKHSVVRNLRTHNAAYVTFTKEGDTFRGATKFAKGLRRTIGSAWDPPNAPVNIRLRGSGSLGVTGGPLLNEVAQSLNMVWLISAGSLEDPFCLMEVCAAVRQGTPVLPVRLAGAGMRPLNLPIWAYSIEAKPSRSGVTTSSALTASSADDTAVAADANSKNGPDTLKNSSNLIGGGGRSGGEHQLVATGGDASNTATEFRERGRRLRRRAVDGFYAQLAQRLPKQVQAELHRNRFLVKDVIAAVRSCLEGTGETEAGDTGQAGAGAAGTRSDRAASATASKARAKPPVFDISDQPADHDMLLTTLVGVNRRKTGPADVEDITNRDKERESASSSWNWEQVPQSAPLAGRARLTDAVPWRTDEEMSEMIKMEEAEADDLAGLLVQDMRTHPSSEQHQWEGCKGLADLAARDSDGLSAVRRQGGIQAILAALAACPKDADVQRWGCQALVPLFSDPIVATPFRQAGIAAVIRALAVLSCCEAALKSMGAVGGAGGGSGARGGGPKATAARARWNRAVKKLEINRVREQRRASLEKSEAAVRAIEREEEELAKKIEASRKSIELELQKEIEAEEDAAVADANDAAEGDDTGETRDNTNSDEGSSSESVDAAAAAAVSGVRGSIDGKDKEGGRTAAEETTPEGQEKPELENNGETENDKGDSNDKDDSSICDDALAEEQRRLEEQDRLEHEAEMARLKKIQDANKLDQWAMTDADIAIYDKAFFKQDKDKDGFISPQEAKSMFQKARTSEDARRHIWEMCDPYRRGKLTQHGWRVAYHLARSMKSRKLELPEALPLCLYPPGFVPGASSPAEKGNDAVDAPEGGNSSQGNREENRKGVKESAGNEGRAVTDENRGAGVGGGECEPGGARGKARGKTKDKQNGKKGGGIFSRNKPASANSSMKEKEGGKGMEAMGLQKKVKTESVGEKETAAVELGPASQDKDKDKDKRKKKTKNTKEKKEVDTGDSDKYHLSDAHKTQYTKVFDKLTKGKTEKKISGNQAAKMLAKSGLSKKDLGKLWAMADADRDGKLSGHEFAVAMHLAACAVGTPALPLPGALPPCLAAASATENKTSREGDGDGPAGAAAMAEEAGSVVLVDDTSSVVSSLGYPEGLSDVDSEEEGGAAAGTRDNAPEKATGKEEKCRQESKKGGASSDPAAARTDEVPGKRTGMTKKARDKDRARGQKDKEEGVAGDGEGEGSATTGTSRKEKEQEGGSEYRMSDQDAARYGKAFDKLAKGNGVTLGGKEAAVVLAKSGLGKKDLGRLWTMSDIDRDGALSRVEFSIAMHLASCSAKKGLPVPRALPESLAALLSQPGAPNEERGRGAAASGEETTTTGSTTTRGKVETPSASSDSGRNSRQRSKREANAGKIKAEAIGDKQGGNGGKDGKRAGTKPRTKNERKEEEKGNKDGSNTAATTEKEAGSSKKRGFEMVSSAAVATTAGPSKTSAAAENDTTDKTTNPASPEADSGGQSKKRNKKATPRDQEQEHHKGDKHATTATAAKQRPASRDKTLAVEAARSKPLKNHKAPKKNKKGKTSSPATTAGQVGSGREAEESVPPQPDQQSGSANAPAETLALVSVPEERHEGRLAAAKAGKSVTEIEAGSAEGDADHDRAETEDEGDDAKTPTKEIKSLSREERDQLYGMSTSERAGYDVIFMQIDADHNGTIDGHEAAKLLGKSGLTRAQLSDIWGLADANDNGELDHDEWAVALHLCRCVAHKHLPLPETLPRSLGGLGLAGGPDDDDEQPDGGKDQGPKGSKAKREAEQAREKEKKMMAGRAVKLREQTQAFRLGKVTAAAFYITLAGAFGAKRHTMIPKVARSLPLDKARALVAAAGLGEEVLEDNEVAEAKLAALRRRRVDEANLHVKATTSNATARDVSLLACRLANRLSATLDDENGGARGTEGVGGDTLGAQISVAADMASAGGVDAVALIFRMFGALDLELMVEALQFSLILARACGAVPIDEAASETSSLASSSHSLAGDRVVETAPEPSPLLPLLRPLYAPSVCKRVAEVAKQFSHSRRTQRLVCLLVGELGSTCGAPARRCFADCCEPIVVATAGGLDEHAASDSDGSSVLGGVGGGGGGKNGLSTSIVASSLPGQGVRDVACQALSILAQEPGLSRRLVAAGAGKASAIALAAAPREHSVQLYGLETIALLAESSCSPGMWESTTIDAPCRLAVQSVQTFIRDPNIHQAASRAILALLVGDAAGDASRSIAAAGGATALARVLATSPNVREVQFPAVLAINELLEGCRRNCADSVPTPASEPGGDDGSASAVAAEPGNVERELIAAAGCELLCKSAKAFPRDRDLRLGCLRAMGALCRGARQAAVGRLIAAGVCEQLMKVVDAYPDDIEVRRAGLALLVGISEHGEGTTEASDDETEEHDDQGTQITTGALASRLGFVGAVDFAGMWLRQVTAPTWAWVAGHGGGGGEEEELARAWDLLMSCKTAFLLTRHSSTNRNRLTSMGAMEALSRAVALSGRKNNLKVGLTPPAGLQQDSTLSIAAETQLWAAQALAELSGGHDNESRCSALMRCGALRALLAAMNKSNSVSQLQRAGCMALGNVASCLKPKDLQALGRNGGAQAVTGAFEACPGDKDVALAGLLAVAKLSMSSENRRLLGQAGVCPLISKELLDFSHDEAVAEEGCRAVTRLAALSGFNRTALGHARAAEATATAMRKQPSKPKVQRWGLSAAAALVAETDPSGNTDRITSAGILGLAVKALMKFRHNPTVQAEGLKTFAKVATSGKDGTDAVWEAGVVLTVVRALGLYLNDANVQHWGVATMRALTGTDDRCDVWRGAGAPEAVVRTLVAFGRDGTGRHARHDEEGLGRASEARPCTAEESLCVQFQACAAAFNLAVSSPDARRRIVREGAGEALAGMMKSNSSNQAALRGALATLAALSASGAENRKRLHRQEKEPAFCSGYKGGVPKAVASALESFPEDRRVRCEGALTVQNLSLTPGGARAMTKAGVAPVIIRLLRATLEESSSPTTSEGEGEGEEGPTLNCAIENGHSGGRQADRDVIVYLLNGLANMAAVDKSLGDFIGRHGACQAVVFALEHHPRDLQMQASGVKAVRALALGGCRNVRDLARLRGPLAIARAQGLFLRDREIQLAVGAAMEALCREGNRANREALVGAGSIVLLESALTQFANDAEVVSQSFRALVEIVLVGTGPKTGMDAEGEDSKRCSRNVAGVEEEPQVKRSFSLPQLTLTEGAAATKGPLQPGEDACGTVGGVAVGEVSCAVEMVLAVLERNPCREVCLEAFAALGRLLVNLGATDSESVNVRSNDVRGQACQNRGAADGDTTACRKLPHNGMDGAVSPAGGLLQLAKVRHAVKRALKINRCDDVGLASRGGQILTLIAVARGRALAQ
ncbi:unnamed protein product [Ectocarpus fasciculatus]